MHMAYFETITIKKDQYKPRLNFHAHPTPRYIIPTYSLSPDIYPQLMNQQLIN